MFVDSSAIDNILFVIDINPECQDGPFFNLQHESLGLTRLDGVKQAVTLFMNLKHRINAQVKFAIASFSETVDLLLSFTDDLREALNAVLSLKLTEKEGKTCLIDINELKSKVGSEPFRIIFIHSNVQLVPQFLDSTSTFVDLIYLHQTLSDSSNISASRAVFRALYAFSLSHSTSYCFEISGSFAQLHASILQFLKPPHLR
eukprot:GCRY01003013.1.p1 GENE.GCRY01003013.1~~GCRY01003013.1.p1  ORF type:complete len:202 (-),score=13.72 GCRY01003013.1:116-721(-)